MVSALKYPHRGNRTKAQVDLPLSLGKQNRECVEKERQGQVVLNFSEMDSSWSKRFGLNMMSGFLGDKAAQVSGCGTVLCMFLQLSRYPQIIITCGENYFCLGHLKINPLALPHTLPQKLYWNHSSLETLNHWGCLRTWILHDSPIPGFIKAGIPDLDSQGKLHSIFLRPQ